MKKVVIQFNIPNWGTKQYEQVWTDLRKAGHENPKGLLYHVSAPKGNDFSVTDVWESEEAFQKFGETLMPILAKNGVDTSRKPEILAVHYEYAAPVKATR